MSFVLKPTLPIWVALFLVLGSGMPLASTAFAQDELAAAVETVDVVVEEEAPAAFDAGDSAYTINTLIMFICAVLVLFMQAGFAMVEVGLNSAKNTVNILAKNVMDLSVGVILFLFLGWGLMYPGEFGIVDGYLGYAGPWVARDATPDLEYGFSASRGLFVSSRLRRHCRDDRVGCCCRYG